MNIVHILTGRVNPNGTNGGDRVIFRLTTALQARGHQVSIFALADKPPFPINGVAIRHFPPPRGPIAWPRELLAALLELRPEVAHLHAAYDPRNAALARWLKRHGIPYAVTPHGSFMPGTFLRRRISRQLVVRSFGRYLLEGALFVHAISDAEARAVHNFAPKARVVVAPHGVEGISPELLDRNYILKRYPILQGKRIFGFLGRMDPLNKGLDLLAEGSALALKTASDIAIVLAGPDWRGRTDALRQRVRQLELSDTVLFNGPIPTGPEALREKFDFMASCDVFVHMSRWEAGIPFSVLDAMEVGKPCLVSRLDFFGDFVERHRAGLQAELTPKAVAEAFTSLSSMTQEELRSMGEAARRGVLAEFSWDRTAGKLLGACQRAVGAGARRGLAP